MLSGVCARPFERLQFLRGTENLYMDLAYDSAEVRTLIEMVRDFYREDVTLWSRSAVDGVFLMDDWGSNTSLLISPEMWRAYFKPIYREFCEIIHRAGKKVFFHSDGNIEAIYRRPHRGRCGCAQFPALLHEHRGTGKNVSREDHVLGRDRQATCPARTGRGMMCVPPCSVCVPPWTTVPAASSHSASGGRTTRGRMLKRSMRRGV